MTVSKANLAEAFAALRFLPQRRPEGGNGDGWYEKLADYRDGGVFIAHYAGNSDWECHRGGDEIVYVVEGGTTLFMRQEGTETPYALAAGELITVPQGVWHRFVTPEGVKVLTITPQPTDHAVSLPED